MLSTLDTDYAVTPEQVAQFQQDGHIKLEGVCPPEEIAVWGPKIHEAALRLSGEKRPLEERETYGKAFLQIGNVWERDEEVKQFVFARRFASVISQLQGGGGVRLYHDQALFKEAGGGYTPWHQDQGYWPLDCPLTITMWMPLVDVTPDMGPMQFVSGVHKLGYLGENHNISDMSEERWQAWVEERGLKVDSHHFYKAGDASFHAGWMLHRASPNTTGNMRAVMTIIYYPDGTRIVPEFTWGGQGDLARWLPGCVPGGPAVSPLNPLLFP